MVSNLIIVWLPTVQIYFFTFVGAFTLYILNKLQKRDPFSLFTAINVDVGPTAPWLIVMSDMILSSIIGTGVVVPIAAPTTVPQAILVGLGMTGILSAHASKAQKND